MNNEIDASRLSRIFGDRVLIRRKGQPEKKRGILIPTSVREKKEPKKIWWGEIVAFGELSIAGDVYGFKIGDTVGIEPIGNHYANWKASDGHEYCWVPDEHLALADEGSVALYYEDALDRKSSPKLRVVGNRILARPSSDDESIRGIIRASRDEENEARLADVLIVGSGDVQIDIGTRVLHVSVDSGSSATIDIFDPPLLVLRIEDIIAESTMMPKEELAHA